MGKEFVQNQNQNRGPPRGNNRGGFRGGRGGGGGRGGRPAGQGFQNFGPPQSLIGKTSIFSCKFSFSYKFS